MSVEKTTTDAQVSVGKLSKYENTFVARQDLSDSQVETITEHYKTLIQDHGGTINKHESWGLRTLAYQIKKNDRGHYVYFEIEAPVAAMTELKRQISLNEDIIRSLVVSVKEFQEGPTAMMRQVRTRYNDYYEESTSTSSKENS